MKIYLAAAAAVLGAAGWLASEKVPEQSATSHEIPGIAAEPPRQPLHIPLADAPKPAAKPAPKQAEAADLNAKVTKALERFKEQTAHISREDVREQQEAVAALKQESLARKVKEPKIEIVDDGHGRQIKKYTYEDGLVRYGL